MLFETVLCRSTGQRLSCYPYNMKIPTGLYVDGFRDYLFIETNQTMQTNNSLVLCWHCWCGLGWQRIRGVNISNASPEYLQPERVISGSSNYLPGYLPSDPTIGQSIVVGSPSFHSLPWFPVNCQLSIPPSHFNHFCSCSGTGV